MKFALPWKLTSSCWLGLLLAFLLGAWLRCYLLLDQVFADDEWHGFYYALGKSPGWLLTHFSVPGATCIPLNFYDWLLGVTTGWSEFLLRLPLLICGLVCVVAGPLCAYKLIGTRQSVWLGWLLAISPTLVFYSRISRPYSVVALLGFLAILLAAHWLQSGSKRAAGGFIVTGVLAIYFHLFAAVTVAAPLLVALVYCGRRYWLRDKLPASAGPSLRQWFWVSFLIGALSAALVLPALIDSVMTTFFTIALAGQFTWQSLPNIGLLISGTGHPVLAGLFGLALVLGAVEQCRRNPWFGWMLVSLYPLHVLALLASRPDCAQSSIMLVRYCIPLVPVSLLLVACGIQAVFDALATRVKLQPNFQLAVFTAWLLALLMTGPLPQCYSAPNNFTSHGAYQHHYGTIDWQRSFHSDFLPPHYPWNTVIHIEEGSPFYAQLAKEPGKQSVVEYPMMIGDHFNPFYYYQHFHQRPVLVGYATDVYLVQGLAAGNVYGSTYVDQVLSLVAHPEWRIRFRNMVDMDDPAEMRRRGAEYVILHKHYEAQLYILAQKFPTFERLMQKYRQTLGAPFYDDAQVVVFRL